METLKGKPQLGRYLKQLRLGYGYSLRKVEEMARSDGGEIDNSQLSRYEKGVCYPSFDKLRTLASIFNVSVQTFSDVVDLEGYADDRPESTDVAELLSAGQEEFRLGSYDRAFADRVEMLSRARLSSALALTRLGKLGLAEQELRLALREEAKIDSSTLARAVLQLGIVHESLGEHYLAEMDVSRGLSLAKAAADQKTARPSFFFSAASCFAKNALGSG